MKDWDGRAAMTSCCLGNCRQKANTVEMWSFLGSGVGCGHLKWQDRRRVPACLGPFGILKMNRIVASVNPSLGSLY